MADVTLRFQGESGNTQQIITALEKRVEKLSNKLDAAGKTGQRSAKGLRGDIARAGVEFAKTAFLAGGIGSALQGALQHARQLRIESERTALQLDKSARKLQIQAGFTALQSEQAQERAGQIAAEAGVDQNVVNRIAQESVSQGLQAPLQTGVVEALIATMQSAGKDPEKEPVEDLVAAFAKFIRASGRKPTGQEFLELGIRTRTLFQDAPIQLTDLPDASKARGVAAKVGVSDEEFLAAFTVARGEQEAAEASTGLGNFITKLAAQDSKVQQTLEKAGVKPGDVDFIGESFSDVLQTLNQALARLDEKERVPFLSGLFGREKVNLQAAQSLLGSVDTGDFRRFQQFQQDEAGFQQGVRVARSGPNAAIAKIQAEQAEARRRFVLSGGILEEEAKNLAAFTDEQQFREAAPALKPVVALGNFLEGLFFSAFGAEPFLTAGERRKIRAARESDFSIESLQQTVGGNQQSPVPQPRERRPAPMMDTEIPAIESARRPKFQSGLDTEAFMRAAAGSQFEPVGGGSAGRGAVGTMAEGDVQDVSRKLDRLNELVEEQNVLMKQRGPGPKINRNAHR